MNSSDARWSQRLAIVPQMTGDQRTRLSAQLRSTPADPTLFPAVVEQLSNPSWRAAVAADPRLAAAIASAIADALSSSSATSLPDDSVDALAELYAKQREANARAEIARAWAAAGTVASLRRFADAMADAPPDSDRAAIAFTPLFRIPPTDAGALFPRLLDALAHVSAAAPTLDLANYFFERGIVSPHPFAERSKTVGALLVQVAERLQRITETGGASAGEQDAQNLVAESVPLLISLSRALALIGDQESVGKLRRAAELPHRILQTHVAAALADLGEQDALKRLAELAAEPLVRNLALAVLARHDALDQVDAKHQSEQARSEGRLAVYLADPSQFGLAPAALELLAEQEGFWPGYDDPQVARIFRFDYRFPQRSHSGVALAAPEPDVSALDLTDLETSDVFAFYAGRSVEHEEIVRRPPSADDHEAFQSSPRIAEQLALVGAKQPVLEAVCDFFGDVILAGTAQAGPGMGAFAALGDDVAWLSPSAGAQPPTSTDAISLLVGRKLLEAFNPPRTP